MRIAIAFAIVALMLMAGGVLSPLVAQAPWSEGPLVPVWTPDLYLWGQLRSGFTVTQENGERFVDVETPDLSSLEAQVAGLVAEVNALQAETASLRSRIEALESSSPPPLPETAILVVPAPVTQAARDAADATAAAQGLSPLALCTLAPRPATQAVPVGFGWSGLPDNPRFVPRCGGTIECTPDAVYYWSTFVEGFTVQPPYFSNTSVCAGTVTVSSDAEIRFYTDG